MHPRQPNPHFHQHENHQPPPRSPRVDAFAPAHLALSGSLRESPERLPKPPGSRDPRLISLRGLPSAGSVGSHSPEMVIRRLARPTPPSELPCGSLSRPFPKVSVHPSGCLCSLPRNRPACVQVSGFRFPLPPFRVLQCGWIRSKREKSGEMTKNEQFLS